VKINKGTYDLHYPDTLGIDHKNRMLYWISNKVIHTSDYNGNFHKTVNKSASYNPNIPRCITFTNAAEYNFYWEKKKVPYHERSFAPNDLLSISYQKNAKVSITSSIDKHIVFIWYTVLKVIKNTPISYQYFHFYSIDLRNVKRLNFDVLIRYCYLIVFFFFLKTWVITYSIGLMLY